MKVLTIIGLLGLIALSLVVQVSAETIDRCGTILRNGIYSLERDIIATDNRDCLFIRAPKMLLDCRGYSITGNSSLHIRGVHINQNGGGINITIQNCVMRDWENIAISVQNTNNVAIKNISIENNRRKGILVQNSNSISISESTIKNNGEEGILLSNIKKGAIKNNYLENNDVWGISLRTDTTNVQIINNTIRGHRGAGISVEDNSNKNTIIQNRITNGSSGIWVEDVATYYTIEGNTIREADMGVVIAGDGGKNIVKNNYVSATSPRSVGFVLYDSKHNVISNNFFNVTSATLLRSSFEDFPPHNLWNITAVNGTNIRGGNRIGGNFWASPNGTGFSQTCSDNNRDGFCDLPYKLGPNNIDFLPLK